MTKTQEREVQTNSLKFFSHLTGARLRVSILGPVEGSLSPDRNGVPSVQVGVD